MFLSVLEWFASFDMGTSRLFMRVNDFEFYLPDEQIAHSATDRTGSRLLCLDGNSGEAIIVGSPILSSYYSLAICWC